MDRQKPGIIERAKEALLPFTFAGALAIAASGCSEDRPPVPVEITRLHAKTVELCTEAANESFESEYPDIEVSDSPSVGELQEALEALESKETEGQDFLQGEFDECMARNFDDVVAGLKDVSITIAPTEPTTTVASETTLGS